MTPTAQFRLVIDCACRYWELTPDAITGSRRYRNYVEARRCVWWVLCDRFRWTRLYTALLFACDTSTVTISLQTFRKDYMTDRFFRERADGFNAMVEKEESNP